MQPLHFATAATTATNPNGILFEAPGQLGAASDGVLVKALHIGDNDAFEEAFRRHYPAVYRVLLRLTGSPEEAEDLAQEVFLRLHQRPLAIETDGEVNLAGWLYRVASNTGFNALRSRRRGWRRALRWWKLERPLTGEVAGPAREAERQEMVDEVRQALLKLKERDRTALILRYSGVSYAEIAAAIGIKPTSVGTTLVRAERALRLAYREGATESASRHYDKTLDESIESRKSKESTDGR